MIYAIPLKLLILIIMKEWGGGGKNKKSYTCFACTFIVDGMTLNKMFDFGYSMPYAIAT